MTRFRNLLRDTCWAWFFAVLIECAILFAEAKEYNHQRAYFIPEKILFFEAFLYGPLFDENERDENLFQAVQILLGEGAVPFQRLAALRVLQGEKMRDADRNLLLGLDYDTITTLISHKAGIPALIKKENERLEKVKMNWLYGFHHKWILGFHPAILVWQIVCIVSLLVHWGKYSFTMNYYPYRKWWFWAFCVVTFPWSSALGIAFLISLFANGISKLIAWHRQANSRGVSYEEFCVSLRKNIPLLRAEWEKIFPAVIWKEEIDKLERRTVALRAKLVGLGRDMETAGREYATDVAKLMEFRKQSEEDVNCDEKLWKEAWREELERIGVNPHVKGLRIINDNGSRLLEIYTGTFSTLWGNLGPMKIVVDPMHGGFSADLAHDAAVLGSIGQQGSRNFCFGNARDAIGMLTAEHKINDALGIMIASFESGSAY